MNVENKIKDWKHWFNLWISGVQLQVETAGCWEDIRKPDQRDTLPAFIVGTKYRIKPREFKDGAYYPILRLRILGNGGLIPDVAQYDSGVFFLTGLNSEFKEEEFKWIGEELEGSLWESSTT